MWTMLPYALSDQDYWDELSLIHYINIYIGLDMFSFGYSRARVIYEHAALENHIYFP